MEPDQQGSAGTGEERQVTDRERPPEDGMQGVAEERGRMGGYGYDTPADMEQASGTVTQAPEQGEQRAGGSLPD